MKGPFEMENGMLSGSWLSPKPRNTLGILEMVKFMAQEHLSWIKSPMCRGIGGKENLFRR